MKSINVILISRWGPAITGTFVGVASSLLVFFGNPGNMGICVACFTRDIAGALGLHRAGAVQYLRPEIPGFILGAFLAAFLSREYRPRSGSSPFVRFFLGFFAMIGALIFLGCPWRAFARLAGGDWNAIAGIGGLAAGIGAGIFFLWNGFSLGRAEKSPAWAGAVMPLAAVALLALLFLRPLFGPEGTGPVFFSKTGPGSAAAPVLISLGVGLAIGWLAQKSRFCTVGALRDLIMLKDGHLFSGVAAFALSAFVVNLVLGQFKPGFANQPVAHSNQLWNFIGMALSGLAFTLAGGCPGRQIIMSGEGDGDASVFVVGMLTGAAFAHNFSLASSAAGVTSFGMTATVIGLVFCLAAGLLFRIKLD